MPGPLDDVTVLELANWVAGPSATALMADMGANVIKVEPLHGDGMRGKLRQPVGAPPTDHPFQLDNRGKRSIAVALDEPEGAALVRELVREADVLVTNLLPNRLARYDIGPETLRAADPRLIYALVTGYGSTGPDADRVAFDVTAFFGRGAISSLLGEPDAPPPASRPGQGDHPTGLALLVAILAALRVRDRTGEGQVVESSLLRTAAWTIGLDVQTALVDRQQPNKRGRADAFGPMNTLYRCGDGTWIILSAQDQGRWPAVCEAIGRPELADDERYATPLARFQHNQQIIAELDAVFGSQPVEHWAPRLDTTGIIWARVAELPDLVDDEQARATGLFVEVDHPAGSFETLAAPFTMSAADVRVRGRAPEIGEHTAEVLREAGVDADRIVGLVGRGVIR